MPSAAALVLVLCALAGGCGGEGKERLSGTVVDDFERKRAEVERHKRFPLYYLGRSFEGLALTEIDYNRERWRPVGFRYGTCEPPAGGEGCAVPLQVLIEPTCFRRRGQLAESLRQTVRGVPAGPLEGSFVLHTGDVLIKISGRGRRRAAEALRPLEAERPGGNLPRPESGPAGPCRY